MHYFFDTEFMEDGRTIELLSIGVVTEDGRTLYLESAEAAHERANDFVREHVLPHLGPVEARVSREAIKRALLELVGPDPQPRFVADYASYDWIAVCQLFGTMIDLPKGWPMFCLDLQQLQYHWPRCPLPERKNERHHALDDARWLRQAWHTIASAEIVRKRNWMLTEWRV